jgi:hypothetical protein
MAATNPLWGAPRIHGELLKLGIDVAERTVSRLLPKFRRPPSQAWRTFLANHVRDLVSIDFFTVPSARLRVLFVLVVLAHYRRRVVHFNVTEHPLPTGRLSKSSMPSRMTLRRPISSTTVTESTASSSGIVSKACASLTSLRRPTVLGRIRSPNGSSVRYDANA